MKKIALHLASAALLLFGLASCADLDPYGPGYGPGYGYGRGYGYGPGPGYYGGGYHDDHHHHEEHADQHRRSSQPEHCYCNHTKCGCRKGHPKAGCHCDGGVHRHR